MYFKNAIQQYGMSQATILFAVLYFLTERAGIADHEIQGYTPFVQDYITQHPELLPTSEGAAKSPLQGEKKTIANNTATNLFSFPLGPGEIESVHIRANQLAIKGNDWSFGLTEYVASYYNDAHTGIQTLEGVDGDNPASEPANSGGSLGNINTGKTAFSSSFANGVVTVTYNPGDLGATPDSFVMNFALVTPTGKTVTLL